MSKFSLLSRKFIIPDYPIGCYLSSNDNQKYIKDIVKWIKRHYNEDQSLTFVVKGSSGIILSTAVTQKLSKYKYNIIPIRKSKHDLAPFRLCHNHLIILDDFIVSGKTIKNIIQTTRNRDFISKTLIVANEKENLIDVKFLKYFDNIVCY